MKENDIYPKFEFRLSHHDKKWLQNELDGLKEKFNSLESSETPVINKNTLIVAALRHGFRYLKSHQRICDGSIEFKPHKK